MSALQIDGQSLTIAHVWDVAMNKTKVQLSPSARQEMMVSRKYIDKLAAGDQPIYGVNTGFGAFSSVRISAADLEKLQVNLIRSHSVGIGEPFTATETRAMMLLRANTLARGHSGVRVEIVETVLAFLNQDLIPVIPSQGSVGASGDLAPLSHLALALIGEGEIWQDGVRQPAQKVLAAKGVTPLKLQAKEGLSLINGCQVMTGLGLLRAFEAQRLLKAMDIAGAMTLEALRGSRGPFDPLISAARPHRGEKETASNLRKILGAMSSISASHENCDRVQDAYSLRCMPAVHGAAKNALSKTIETLEIESNSSTDNPLVFHETGKILSCGNFHGEPVAFALDFAAIAMTAAGSMSECRTEKMINPAMSGLPAFLAPQGGLNSGMMIVHVAAASLVSENKVLSHPASVDSIPTSADKEDHVSMGTIAARKFASIVRNVENIIAIELFCAAQALDLLRPLRPDGAIKVAYDLIRKDVAFAEEDRVFSIDIEKVRHLLSSGQLVSTVEASIGKLEV